MAKNYISFESLRINSVQHKYIHEIENWTEFQWDAEMIAADVDQVSRKIGHLMGRLASIGFNEKINATMETVTRDIVASSEIEGLKLNTQEVRSSVARQLGIKIKDEKEPTHYIEGVVKMMLDAVMNFDLPLTEERLFGWHAALFPSGYSGYEKIHVASYRTDPMKVISGAFGRERVHYVAPEAERVPAEMEKFLKWINDESVVPSLVKSAIAHLWFVAIHPFDDGNGRISRAISDMLISQTDGSKFRFFSMSQEICREKGQYYTILEHVTSRPHSLREPQDKLSSGQAYNDITEWIHWYLMCLSNAVTESETTLSGVLSKSIFWRTHSGVALSERQQKGLNTYLDGYEAKLTVKNWAKLFKISPDTASRDIKDLVEKNIVKAVKGRVRDVAYTLVYTSNESLLAKLSEITILQMGNHYWINAIAPGDIPLQERITELDFQRYSQEELHIEDLACKYFAYITD